MVWWFLMAGIDLLTGLFKALRHHRWKSSIDWTGLMKHFVTLLTIIMASAIDHVAPIVGVTLPVNVGLVWTAILLTYEFGSIVENAGELGINIGPLKKYLAIFDEAIDPLDKEEK